MEDELPPGMAYTEFVRKRIAEAVDCTLKLNDAPH